MKLRRLGVFQISFSSKTSQRSQVSQIIEGKILFVVIKTNIMHAWQDGKDRWNEHSVKVCSRSSRVNVKGYRWNPREMLWCEPLNLFFLFTVFAWKSKYFSMSLTHLLIIEEAAILVIKFLVLLLIFITFPNCFWSQNSSRRTHLIDVQCRFFI